MKLHPFTRPTEPSQAAVDIAVHMARNSTCAKSKRGVAIYSTWFSRDRIDIAATGYNHLPGKLRCDGSEACRRDCGKICIHAEDAAIRKVRTPIGGLYLVHAKVDVAGSLVPGGPPSCWQCSRLILDEGIEGVWLFEAQRWHDEMICEACRQVTVVKQNEGSTMVCEKCKYSHGILRFSKTVYDESSGEWRLYLANEFHHATLKNCGLHISEAP